MGGPGGGGGGYATTGSIGATAGSGGDAVDECGLRFLLAMRHHTCLMRSLPPKHRAVLEERVKFIVYLTVQLAYGTCLSLAEMHLLRVDDHFPNQRKTSPLDILLSCAVTPLFLQIFPFPMNAFTWPPYAVPTFTFHLQTVNTPVSSL